MLEKKLSMNIQLKFVTGCFIKTKLRQMLIQDL